MSARLAVIVISQFQATGSAGQRHRTVRLRLYLPGNGGLLTAVALMCAGWDGCKEKNPGFPAGWDVEWEGLLPMP